MSKQDRQGVRTPADLDRRYYFGKTFDEMTKATDEAQKAADNAKRAAEQALKDIGDLDQDKIFNILTNNGEAQGIYRLGNNIYFNASYIGAGDIVSQNYSEEYAILKQYVWEILAGQYYFTLGGKNYTFTLANTHVETTRFEFYPETMMLNIVDMKNGSILESVTVEEGTSGTELSLDITANLPIKGTRIDLTNGVISTPQLKVDENGNAYFGGKLFAIDGRISGFDLYENSMVSGNEGVAIMISGNQIRFDTYEYNTEDYVSFEVGSYTIDEELGFDPRQVLIRNSKGDCFRVVPNAAELIGSWKATPYTSKEGVSEIVTKQDLINLGLDSIADTVGNVDSAMDSIISIQESLIDGDVEAALDNIIKLQNQLIGGGAV